MAKRHRRNLITASFHYLIKIEQNEEDPTNPTESPFTSTEFEKIKSRISDNTPLDERDANVINRIKIGHDLPFSGFEEVEEGLYFGNFDGAYYGQQYRNNIHGIISADSLNLRPFNYLITRLRDGKILVGVTYNGQFGDYDGLRNCLSHILRGNHHVCSRTITSVSDEIGNGVPTELKLTYRNANDRPERRSLFGRTGVIAIKNTDFGDDFGEEVGKIAKIVKGDSKARKQTLAHLVKQGNLIELDDEDIIGCSAIIREDGRKTTVYFLGGNSLATKFRLNVTVDIEGIPDRSEVKNEMIKTMREKVISLIA